MLKKFIEMITGYKTTRKTLYEKTYTYTKEENESFRPPFHYKPLQKPHVLSYKNGTPKKK